MHHDAPMTREALKTPRAAAVAGILFSVLLIAVLLLLRLSVPADPREQGVWLATSTTTVVFALNLIPIAGIAFLWFIGVLRDRLGQREDRFFATVFLGSGLLFLAMLFVAAAMVGAIILAFADAPPERIDSDTFHLARAAAYNIVNVYMVKMAVVFMVSLSTVALYTGIAARWMSFLGYALALLLLFGNGFFGWAILVFPVWVLLVSAYILTDNLRRPSGPSIESPR